MELIDREEVLCYLQCEVNFWKDEDEKVYKVADIIKFEIEELPIIESRPKGKWISVDCSICGNRRRGTPRYCENCGAEMREVERVKGLSERMVIKNDKWLQI